MTRSRNTTASRLARELRRNQTEAEAIVWARLRAKRYAGVKFKRQVPVGTYIVDFCSFDHKLIIEIDGGHHASQIAQDRARSSFLESQGFTVLRFWNNEVLGNLEGVFFAVQKALDESPSP